MNTSLTIFRSLILCFAMLPTHTSSKNTCVDLQLTSGSEDNVVQENEDGDVHITFVLSDTCPGNPSQAMVKLSTHGTEGTVDFCTIILRNNICHVTDQPTGHHCLNTEHNRCSISWKVKTAHKLLKLRLTDIITQEEKVISLNITGPASKRLGTPEIIGICCGVVAVITAAVVSAVVVIKKGIFRGDTVYTFT